MLLESADVARRFGSALDGVLDHNRRIVRAADDSVVRVIDGAVTPLRVGRGLAPVCLRIPETWGLEALRGDIVALGAHEKASVAILRGDTLFLSQHLGDLDSVESREAYAAATEEFLALFDVRPALIVHDAHPDYFSTRMASELGDRFACAVESVQHHAAHLYAALLDAAPVRLPASALALCWDGTGLGADGSVWGGETLAISSNDPGRPRRVGSLHPFPLVGGDACVREPWRVALALMREAGIEKDGFAWKPDRSGFVPPPGVVAPLARALERGAGTVPCTSMGRLFDAVASLLGLRHRIQFSAQAAMEVEEAAATRAHRLYPANCTRADPDGLRFDWRPMIRDIVEEVRRGIDPAEIAAAFHMTLAEVAAALTAIEPRAPVFLAGGCFQNRRLAEAVAARIRAAGRTVHLHRRVPPNDGGLAAGQALACLFRPGRRQEGSG